MEDIVYLAFKFNSKTGLCLFDIHSKARGYLLSKFTKLRNRFINRFYYDFTLSSYSAISKPLPDDVYVRV